MGRTAYQKIIHKNLLKVLPDGTLVVRAKKKFCHEITTPPYINDAIKNGYDVVYDSNSVFAMIDHVSPAKDSKTALQGQIMRDWSSKHKIPFFDIGDGGVCHVLITGKFLVEPGDTAVMGDSHTCTYGALCAFSMGVGTTDLGCSVGMNFFLLKPQKVFRVNFVGKLPANVYPKDLALLTVKHFGKGGAKNAIIEFRGNVIDEMSMGGRFTMSNMTVEAGGTCGMMMVDMTTINYLWPGLKQRYKTKGDALKDLSRWNSDPDCEYNEEIEINVSNLRPVTTINYHPSEVVKVNSMYGKKFDQVVIGSCTNGRIEDLRIAAEIIKQCGTPKVKVRTIIIPATWDVYDLALKEGLIKIFRDAGCCVLNPSCGPCLGMSCGVIAWGEVCLATTNRNYEGRMGKKGMVHLVSPATAMYSAILGEFAELRKEFCVVINKAVDSHDEVIPFTRVSVPVEKIDFKVLRDAFQSSGEGQEFSGKPFFLKKEKVNTDEIISAEYLTEVDKSAFGEHCLETLVTEPSERKKMYRSKIIVSDIGFGDGSSREQAPWALEGAGIRCVIAKSFERIFETNYFNNALLAIQAPSEVIDELFKVRPDFIEVVWSIDEGEKGYITWDQGTKRIEFEISELEKDTIRKGGKVGVMLEIAAELQEAGII